jgi:hypothetical protein
MEGARGERFSFSSRGDLLRSRAMLSKSTWLGFVMCSAGWCSLWVGG